MTEQTAEQKMEELCENMSREVRETIFRYGDIVNNSDDLPEVMWVHVLSDLCASIMSLTACHFDARGKPEGVPKLFKFIEKMAFEKLELSRKQVKEKRKNG